MAGDFSLSEGKILNTKKLTILTPTWVDRIKQKSIVISTTAVMCLIRSSEAKKYQKTKSLLTKPKSYWVIHSIIQHRWTMEGLCAREIQRQKELPGEQFCSPHGIAACAQWHG